MIITYKHIQNDVPVDCVWSCSLEGNFSFLYNDYKTLLKFFIRVSTTMSAGLVQEIQGHALYVSPEGF